MNMIAYSSKNDTDQIGIIAARLADNFLIPLYDFCNEKNHFVYIGCLSQIFNWSCEFYCQYRHKLNDLKNSEEYDGYKNDIVTNDDFLVAWGQTRIKQFFAQHAKAIGYSADQKDRKQIRKAF